MAGCPLFEEAIVSLIKIEIDSIAKNKNLKFEQSASCRFIGKLVSVCLNTPASDEGLAKKISFTASLIRMVIHLGLEKLTQEVLIRL